MAVTRTLGPLHFEDLDPHRFEDLVRELIYDFRDWQSIEATGRGGGDEGFDIRAYERANLTETAQAEGEVEEEDDLQPHPMEGNLWMFQCKREAEIGPTKVAQIIDDGVKAQNAPYGYVLAAPANFSKKAFDVFREELRKRGVMEFYLWGRAALEDMLHFPKNDRVLFTFFGVSLVSRRKSRATEIRAVVSRKNKLMRVLGEQPRHQPILVRDTKDIHYPYSSKYKDFDKNPRWKVCDVRGLHPLGLVISVEEGFAYLDSAKGEWDMTGAINLVMRHEEDDNEEHQAHHELRERVESFWHFIPHAKRATYVKNGLIKFDDIAVIDDKGDSEFKFPHIFVDFQGKKGPFYGFFEYLKPNEHRREYLDGLKRKKVFPEEFGPPRIGTIHPQKTLKIADRARGLLTHGNQYLNTFYDVGDAFDFLMEGDVIGVEGTEDKVGGNGGPVLVQITNKQKVGGETFLASLKDDPGLKHRVQEQIGREVTGNDELCVIEFKVVYAWAIERLQKSAKRSSS